jgi:hypothetical protein
MSLDFLLLLTFLATLVVIGSRLGFSSLEHVEGPRSPLRVLGDTGTPFVLIGAIMGPQVLNLLSTQVLSELDLVLLLGYGAIGFLYGSHFEWRRLKRFPARMYWAGLLQSTFTVGVVSLVSWLAIPLIHEVVVPRLRLTVALAMGACAGGTAPAGVFLLAASRSVRRADIQALRFFAAIDDLPGVMALGVIFSLLNPLPAGQLEGWQSMLLALAIGLLMGGLTHWLFPTAGDVRDNTLMLIGVSALGAGSAALLGISPLFVAVVAGALFANLSPRKESAYGLLASRETTLYALFLLIAGAMFRFETARVLWVLVPTYVLVRGLAKILGAYLGRQLFLASSQVSRQVGAGLLFQGGMSLVMAVHVDHSLQMNLTYIVMTTFVLAVFINDLAATSLARAALRRRTRARRPQRKSKGFLNRS